jgi:hypothetical protein
MVFFLRPPLFLKGGLSAPQKVSLPFNASPSKFPAVIYTKPQNSAPKCPLKIAIQKKVPSSNSLSQEKHHNISQHLIEKKTKLKNVVFFISLFQFY